MYRHWICFFIVLLLAGHSVALAQPVNIQNFSAKYSSGDPDEALISLRWRRVPAAQQYYCDIALDSGFTTKLFESVPLLIDTFLSNDSIAFARLRGFPGPGPFFVRMIARTTTGWTAYSPTVRTQNFDELPPLPTQLIVRLAQVESKFGPCSFLARWNLLAEPQTSYKVNWGVLNGVGYFTYEFLPPYKSGWQEANVCGEGFLIFPTSLGVTLFVDPAQRKAQARFYPIQNEQTTFIQRFEQIYWPELPVRGDSTYYVLAHPRRFTFPTRLEADTLLLRIAQAGIPLDTAWYRQADTAYPSRGVNSELIVKLRSQDTRLFSGQFGGWVTMKSIEQNYGGRYEGGGFDWNWTNTSWFPQRGPHAFRYSYRRTPVGVGVSVQEPPAASELVVEPPVPNPASEEAVLHYTLPQPAQVSITLSNALGQEVLRLPTEQRGAGMQSISLNVAALPAGVYLCRVQAGERICTHTLLVRR